ncbi:tetratricopeptide repeat protein, partial [bacterium]|nr:tetratricopeptide repeat protein [bacterium]
SQTFSQTDATASTSVSQPIQTVLVQPLPEKAQTTSSPVPSNPTTQPTPQAGMTAKIEQIIGTARESPQDASVQFLCAVQLQRFKDTENAKLLFKETIALEPEFAEAYYNLAQIYQNEGNLQEAVSFLESAVKANPDNSKFKSVLANILMDRGDISEASALAKSSAELDPNNSEGHFALARVYYASKRHQEALDAIAKGFEIESQAPTQIYQSLNELRNQVKSEMVSH